MPSGEHIVVIGAGVVGLTAALELLIGGFDVTVVASHISDDKEFEYTSPWAGIKWRTHAALGDLVQQGWDIAAYRRWNRIHEQERYLQGRPKSGIQKHGARFYWASQTAEVAENGLDMPWWAKEAFSFRKLPSEELPEDIYAGCTYDAFTIDVPRYLHNLGKEVKDFGGKLLQAQLPINRGLSAFLDAAGDLVKEKTGKSVNAYVNATGLNAGKIVPDESVYPIRGQTVVVRGEASQLVTIEDVNPSPSKLPSITYVLPHGHSGTTILGGTRQADNWNSQPDPNDTKDILERCKRWAPELLTGSGGTFEILSVQVSLRAGRKGGAKLLLETVGGKLVCHCYGHAGAEYQNSSGANVLNVLQEHFS